MSRTMAGALVELARTRGVQTSFRETTGRRRFADTEALLAVLAALGEPVARLEDAPGALERARAVRDRRLVEPVVVAWDGRPASIEVRLPAARPPARIGVHVELEGGEERSWVARTEEVRSGERTARLPLERGLPLGRHALTVEAGRHVAATTLLSAPRTASARAPRDWGVFLPLYALVTRTSWGIGDLTGLGALADLVGDLGGGLIATLPLLAAFEGEASPYRPASRLFWNEAYVDVEAVPEVAEGALARRLLRSPRFRRELEAARAGEHVDHGRAVALKRRVLERAASSVEGPRARAFRRFLRERPETEAYARFRAAGERYGLDWHRWPAEARRGRLRASELDQAALAYHRFAQWVAEEQVAELGHRSRASGGGLYVDMPLGVHPWGYDGWRHRAAFASGVSVGAPPDDFFPGGQDWGFAPLHPERVRDDGYAYPIATLRHAFRHAGVARIDHVIGLHRQYWVPSGAPADRGVFVRYPAEEWYAAIALESHRAGTVVVGEDLGTVPDEVRRGLGRHGLLRSYVLQLEAFAAGEGIAPPPRRSLASLNTHDLPTFATFWRETEVGARRAVVATLRDAGLLDPDEADDERAVLAAALEWLASSDARLVVVNLEDLWGERRPQNVPGVVGGASWRRRAAVDLEEVATLPDVLEMLKRVDAGRRVPVSRRPA